MTKNKDAGPIITTALEILNSDDVKVPSSKVEDLANFKNILKAILSGSLVLASPDRILPEGEELPKQENDTPKGN